MALVEPTVQAKIERMYQARARLVRKAGDDMLVFALSGHPSARLCYAWERDGRVSTELDPG